MKSQITLQTTLNGKFVPEEICAYRLYWSQQYSKLIHKGDMLMRKDRDIWICKETGIYHYNFSNYMYREIVVPKPVYVELRKELKIIERNLKYWNKMMKKHCYHTDCYADSETIKKWVFKKEQRRKK